MVLGSTTINLAQRKSTLRYGERALAPPINEAFVGIYPVEETVPEGGICTYEVRRTVLTSVACSVTVNPDDPIDGKPGYVNLVPITLDFAAGQTIKQVSFATQNVTGAQGDRYVGAYLSNAVGCQILDDRLFANIKITDAVDATVSVSATLSSVTEPETGTVLARFRVTRSGDTTNTCSVRYTRTGTITNADLAPPIYTTGTLQFSPGVQAFNFDFQVAADALVEPDEYMDLTIDNPVNCVIPSANRTARINVIDLDIEAKAILNVTANPANVTEGDVGDNPEVQFEIARTGTLTSAVTVQWVVTLSTGLNSTDFVGTPVFSGTASFGPGIELITVNYIIAGDTNVEGDEVMTITLSNPSANAELGSQTTATITIANDDTSGTGVEVVPALRRILVDNQSELTSVLNATSGDFAANITVEGSTPGSAPSNRQAPLRAGDHVLIASGSYSNEFNVNCNGTATNPIYIMARDEARANWPIFTGNVLLGSSSSTAQYTAIRKLDFTGAGRVQVYGNRSAMIRCALHDITSTTGRVVRVYGDYFSILFCDFRGINCIHISCYNDVLDGASKCAFQPYIYRTVFRDSLTHASGRSNEGIQFGTTDGAANVLSNYYIDGLAEQCYFYNFQKTSGNSDNEAVSVKSAGNVLLQCVLDQSRTLTNRHGFMNDIISCTVMSNSDGIIVKGSGDVIAGNSAPEIRLDSGSNYQEDGPWDPPGPANPVNRAACDNCLVVSNIATLQDGEYNGDTSAGHPECKNYDIRIENHTGTIRTQVNYSWSTAVASFRERDSTYQATTLRTYPSRNPSDGALTLAKCGLDAPWRLPSRNFGSIATSWTLRRTVANSPSEWTVWGGSGSGTGVTLANPTTDGVRMYGGPTPSNDSMRLMAWLTAPLHADPWWKIEFDYRRIDSTDPGTGIASMFWVGTGINYFPADIISENSDSALTSPTIARLAGGISGHRLTFNTAYNNNDDLNSQLRLSTLPADEYHLKSLSAGVPATNNFPGQNFPFTSGRWYRVQLIMHNYMLKMVVTDQATPSDIRTFRMYGSIPGKVFGIYLQPYRDIRVRNMSVWSTATI